MKYIRTAIAEQETTINILYDEQIIKVYSSRVEIIKILTKQLGEPTKKYKKSKSYWSGANWDIEFNDLKKIEKLLIYKMIIDSDINIKEKNKKSGTTKKEKELKQAKKTRTPKKEKTVKKEPLKTVKENKKTEKELKQAKKSRTPKKEKAVKKEPQKIVQETKKVNKVKKNKKVKPIKNEGENQFIEYEQFSLI